MPPINPDRTLIRRANMLPRVIIGNNEFLTVVAHYQNFEGGYLVDLSQTFYGAGERSAKLRHRGAITQFFVLTGRGVIVVNQDPHNVRAGDSVMIPAGATYNVIGGLRGQIDSFEVVRVLVVAPGHENDKKPWLPT